MASRVGSEKLVSEHRNSHTERERKMKRFLVGILIVLVALVLMGCEATTPRTEQERERTQQIEALVEPVTISAEYSGKMMLILAQSYTDIAEDDARALRQLATYEMRKHEARESFLMIALAACALIALVWAVGKLEIAREGSVIHFKVRE